MILRDFLCQSCHSEKEELVESHARNIKCECGSLMRVHFKKMAVSGIDSFNPHYDLQLGKHFHSAEEKKKYLSENNWVQTSGTLSPRKSSGVETLCTKGQYKKNEKQL